MRNHETYLHNLPFYKMLDKLNTELTKVISVREKPTFSPFELAWFRRHL